MSRVKNTNKKTLKTLAGGIAVILMGGILFVKNPLVGLGIVIAMLLKFAFKKER